MRQFALGLGGFLALSAAGCVEGEQVFTLNPDGSGKVKIDVVMAPPFDPLGGPGGPGGNDKDLTTDQLLQRSLRPLLQARGITGWKDVSASFTPEGKFKFSAIGYFKHAEQVEFQNIPLLGPQYALAPGPDGSLLLKEKKKMGGGPEPDGPTLFNKGPGKKPPEELAKMSDQQLDAYILRERIEYQSTKSLLIAVFADTKMKATYVLPGKPEMVSGFKTDGQKVFFELDGNKFLAGINKVYSLDAAAIRKLYRSREAMDEMVRSAVGFFPDESVSATVKPAGPQFDYNKEVTAARAAYPELRKKLNLDPSIRLPETDEAPGVPPFPPK